MQILVYAKVHNPFGIPEIAILIIKMNAISTSMGMSNIC